MSDPQPLPATWLVGRKVRLRPIEPEDVPLLRRWHAGGTALAWLDRPMPLPSAAVADWAARASIDPESTWPIRNPRSTSPGRGRATIR